MGPCRSGQALLQSIVDPPQLLPTSWPKVASKSWIQSSDEGACFASAFEGIYRFILILIFKISFFLDIYHLPGFCLFIFVVLVLLWLCCCSACLLFCCLLVCLSWSFCSFLLFVEGLFNYLLILSHRGVVFLLGFI
jgi:hypothetical protein